LKGAEQDPVADYQAHDPRIAAFASVVDAYDLHGLVFRNFSITSKTRFFFGDITESQHKKLRSIIQKVAIEKDHIVEI